MQQVSQSLTLSATNHSSIKAIVIVANYGYRKDCTNSGVFNNGIYNNKWSVWIINNMTLLNGNISFLGYTTSASWTPVVGAKIGAIGIFSQALTASEITSITNWGLLRFSAL